MFEFRGIYNTVFNKRYSHIISVMSLVDQFLLSIKVLGTTRRIFETEETSGLVLIAVTVSQKFSNIYFILVMLQITTNQKMGIWKCILM